MVRFQEYTDQYKQQTIDIILEVWENEFDFKGLKRPDIYNIQETYIDPPRSNFWLIFDEDQLIGTVAVLEKNSKFCHLKRMLLIKSKRGQGIGIKALNHAIEFAKEVGFKRMLAGTVEENPNAIKFYLDHGFIKQKEAPEDITAANDSICLELKL